MKYDMVIVGAGPAGLSTAIKLKQLNTELSVCILEKSSEVGAHILSGNVFDTKALDELIPNWKDLDSPIKTDVRSEDFLFYTNNKSNKKITTDRIDALNLSPKDLAGAGDSMLIISGMALASKSNIWEAACLGSLASAIQVSRLGNIPIKKEEFDLIL